MDPNVRLARRSEKGVADDDMCSIHVYHLEYNHISVDHKLIGAVRWNTAGHLCEFGGHAHDSTSGPPLQQGLAERDMLRGNSNWLQS